MTATYLGSHTVGNSVPGIRVEMDHLAIALSNLRDAAQVALTGINMCSLMLNAQAIQIPSIKSAIRIPSVAMPQANLDAAVNFANAFLPAITDPLSYLSQLLAGLTSVQANLSAALPVVVVDTQLAAAQLQAASFGAAVDAIDAALAALDDLGSALLAILAACSPVHAALSAAITAAGNAIIRWQAYTATISASGAHCFFVEAQLQNVGAELQSVLASSGIGATVVVRVPVVLVEQGDASASLAVDAVFRTP